MNQEKKLADIPNEEMTDNSLRSQDDSGGSDKSESAEFDTEEKLDTAETIEFIQNCQEYVRDFVRLEDPTFNQYLDRLKALGSLMKR